MDTSELREQITRSMLEYDEQAAAYMLCDMIEEYKGQHTIAAAIVDGVQALLSGKMLTEDGEERADSVQEGIVLVLSEVAAEKSGPGAMALRAAVYAVKDDQHFAHHPEHEA